MVRFGKWIVRHKRAILILSLLLLVPSIIGFSSTKINYDILSYLPDHLETVEGQDVLVDEFGMGAFSMIIVEDMPDKDVSELKEKLMKVDHVKDILWYDSLADISMPKDMLPDKVREAFNTDDATLMIALFDNTTADDDTMNAVEDMRKICNKQCFISGMTGVNLDVKQIADSEAIIYVMIAALLSLIVLTFFMDSFAVPPIFLASIGMGILYNLGSNVFLGDICYITKALAAVLQLGVTMDYSIFLLNSYEENKIRFDGDKDRAMAHAISNTFKSVVGSSITTIAGFVALCFMTFTLGMDIGIVMAKGVVIGVLCCITLLPSLILIFDPLIEKTKHRSFCRDLSKASHFITKHYLAFFVLFLALLFPAIYGNNHVKVYYNIDQTLPDTLGSTRANKKLGEEFKMNNLYMILMKNSLSDKEKTELLSKIEEVKGIKWSLGLNSLIGCAVPSDMLPKEATSSLKSENYEIAFVASDYKTATDEINTQINEINKIVKSYDDSIMVIGEAPLTKDLVDITAVDLRNVSIASIAAIFLIILIVFKSASLPVLLVAVIEFAINVNMSISYYTGVTLPFVASIVIGTIQLGATVDYAILMTGRYQKERNKGASKKEAIRIAHETSMKSIMISGISFFAATFGVCMYSQIDMISAICTLLSRGALISTVVVICILPAMFMLFDPVICHTSIGFLPKKEKKPVKPTSCI